MSFSSQYEENNTPDRIFKVTYLFASGGRDGTVHIYDVERFLSRVNYFLSVIFFHVHD